MPRQRPATSGYARIAQAEEEEDLDAHSEDEDAYRGQTTISNPSSRYAPIQPKRQGRMHASGTTSPSRPRGPPRSGSRRSNSGVDIKAINARLERWADEIASKFKIRRIKGKTEEEEQLEIQHSVFQAPDWIRPATAESLAHDYPAGPDRITKEQFDDAVESVRLAIEQGIHPKLISQGSSGSYFARTPQGKVVGVFKPKDEEPYASRNPKWTKWIHRNLFPWFFGRACLIPNLSYVSEAAAYVLDVQLRTNIVPYTDIVSLSSKSFYYDFWDRRAFYRKKKPLPEKIGSFQIFLKGFKDANVFLKEHPWPDQHNSGFRTDAAPRRKKRRWGEECRPGGAPSDDEEDHQTHTPNATEDVHQRRVFWTDSLQQSFREQLEKLVILDYIMRNTDRGLDNWMIKISQNGKEASIIAEPPKSSRNVNGQAPKNDRQLLDSESDAYRRHEPMQANSRASTPMVSDPGVEPSVAIGAIDNSLSWPWKHPDAVCSPLEMDLVIQDSDFKESMFARQIAVMKGQAWNVVETLKVLDHGPLELTRRARVCVWDDLVDVPVAVPLRVPSAEMRRRRAEDEARMEEEEMDISAARASAPQPQHDLLGTSSPTSELPNGNRFNLTRHASALDARESEDSLGWTARPKKDPATGVLGASAPGSKPRSSYEGVRRQKESPDSRRRRYSLTGLRRGSNSFLMADDDLEGDLGYAAAEDMEGMRKKVIIERLETVKSKNPVFTWC
ncbi:Phosphatidylinositol 4-kinase LSB6 [Coniosporium apollinis]|uniref:Phosphatidylinositol 4-kinase n=1 Tax=Coniosporium apollinis TaxID=61459 RepID=A0ABQ9NM07_9PEZI|nr:Phosphatidylinositol 4-kinase LSB6 [Coniosporium apollinis]